MAALFRTDKNTHFKKKIKIKSQKGRLPGSFLTRVDMRRSSVFPGLRAREARPRRAAVPLHRNEGKSEAERGAAERERRHNLHSGLHSRLSVLSSRSCTSFSPCVCFLLLPFRRSVSCASSRTALLGRFQTCRRRWSGRTKRSGYGV